LLLSSLEATASSESPCSLRHSDKVMLNGSAFLNIKSSGNVQFFGNAKVCRASYNLYVLDWHLKEWLAATGTSQAELCRRTDYPKAKVSDLVTGKQRYNRDVLNDVAHALNIQPYELLMHPADAMAQRRMRRLAEQMVQIPHGGSTTDIEEISPARKAG
jgi:transcriptional regulator with XRE-family HTH domain